MRRLKPTDLPPLLYTRRQTARLYGASVSTIKRLEEQGHLVPVRLTRRGTGQIYYRAEHVLRLIELASKPTSN
jgi:hypothetical protein